MKKIFIITIFILLLLFSISLSTAAAVTLKLGYDYSGDHRQLSTTENTDPGYTLALELTKAQPGERSEWGCGIEAATTRQIEDTDQGFQFIPIYGSYSFYGAANDEKSLYLTTRLGINIFIADQAYKGTSSTEGGSYYALGFGYSSGEHNRVEMLYSVCMGDLGGAGIRYTRTSVSYGFRF